MNLDITYIFAYDIASVNNFYWYRMYQPRRTVTKGLMGYRHSKRPTLVLLKHQSHSKTSSEAVSVEKKLKQHQHSVLVRSMLMRDWVWAVMASFCKIVILQTKVAERITENSLLAVRSKETRWRRASLDAFLKRGGKSLT